MNIKHLSITLSTLLLASSTLLAENLNKNTKKLDTITIIGQDNSSYLDYEKPTITRGNIQAEDMSRSVQVFNNNFIENYQAKEVFELPSLSSNVTYGGHNRSRGVSFNIRGFNNDSILRDGLAVPQAIPNTELFNIERVEVLKGPDSIQFGQSNPGGLINFVKKKPLREEHGELLLEVNDNTLISPKLDIGGMIGDKLSYRLVTSYTKDETFKNFTNDFESVFVAPSLTYDIDDNNSIDFILEVNNEDKPYDFGAISYTDKGELMHDRDKVISSPHIMSTREQTTYGLDYKNTSGNFESNVRYRHVNYEFDLPSSYYPSSVDYANKTVTGAFADMNMENKTDIFQYTLSHKYENDTLENNFNIGMDYTKDRYDEYTGFTGRVPAPGSTQEYDLANGIYPALPSSFPTGLVSFRGANGVDTTESKGIFLQNSLTLNRNLVINTGLRYDKVEFDSRPGLDSDFKKDNITPQIGFVYKINPNSSVYANYSESFLAQTTRDINGKTLDPETGKGYEIGLRQSLFDDQLNLTTSIFKIQKENVAINHGSRFLPDNRASGVQTSKGFEIDLGGNITEDFAVLASYGYAKTEGDNGKRFDNVAKHTGNIYGTYNIDNIYLSGGLQYVGDRYHGDVKYDSYLISNVNVSYKKNNWLTSIGVKNLSDKEYLSSVSTYPGGASIGTPRTIYASTSYKF